MFLRIFLKGVFLLDSLWIFLRIDSTDSSFMNVPTDLPFCGSSYGSILQDLPKFVSTDLSMGISTDLPFCGSSYECSYESSY